VTSALPLPAPRLLELSSSAAISFLLPSCEYGLSASSHFGTRERNSLKHRAVERLRVHAVAELLEVQRH